jgi:hypothetical protein
MDSLPFHGLNNFEFKCLFPKKPKNYDICYDEHGRWSYYRGVWLMDCPAGHDPLDYPPYDDYDDPRDLD